MPPGPVKRKLTAILAADAVGYSRHMAADEEGTMKILSAHRAVIDGIIEFHEGRIINTAGDSVLAEFASPTDAVRCAVEIQDALKTRNDSLPETRRLYFRIGVNLGDVMVKGDDLLGDGVNVAARLEGIAEPGNIYVSSSVYDQISGKLDLGFSDMGEQSLKNIDRPIRVYRVEREGRRPPAQTAKKQRRSVLPWVAAGGAFVAVAAGAVWYHGHMESARQQEEAKAQAATAETARLRAEAEAVKQRAEKERAAALEAKRAMDEKQAAEARARAQAELARARSEAEDARRKAQSELAAAAEARRAAESAAKTAPAQKEVMAAPRYAPGAWSGHFSCAAFEGAPAGTLAARAYVSANAFEVQSGQPEQPGSLRLTGVPHTDGSLHLAGMGLSGHQKYRGQAYKASFEGKLSGERYEGSGRLGRRDCTLVLSRAGAAPPPSYQGQWTANFACAAFEGEQARTFAAAVVVVGAGFELQVGKPDQPGWLQMRGVPQADGRLLLAGSGLSRHESYRGKPYKAAFDGKVSGDRYDGHGRLGRRDCALTMARK
ncbi:MAG: adenylate/guanylate cyclase domain-containing protein [Betaproteobacteria bacterium]